MKAVRFMFRFYPGSTPRDRGPVGRSRRPRHGKVRPCWRSRRGGCGRDHEARTIPRPDAPWIVSGIPRGLRRLPVRHRHGGPARQRHHRGAVLGQRGHRRPEGVVSRGRGERPSLSRPGPSLRAGRLGRDPSGGRHVPPLRPGGWRGGERRRRLEGLHQGAHRSCRSPHDLGSEVRGQDPGGLRRERAGNRPCGPRGAGPASTPGGRGCAGSEPGNGSPRCTVPGARTGRRADLCRALRLAVEPPSGGRRRAGRLGGRKLLPGTLVCTRRGSLALESVASGRRAGRGPDPSIPCGGDPARCNLHVPPPAPARDRSAGSGPPAARTPGRTGAAPRTEAAPPRALARRRSARGRHPSPRRWEAHGPPSTSSAA